MVKYMTEEEQAEFWCRHGKSRKAIGEAFAKLPPKKKVEVIEKMNSNHTAMRNAKIIKKGANP